MGLFGCFLSYVTLFFVFCFWEGGERDLRGFLSPDFCHSI